MNYEEAIRYLDSFINYESVPFFDYKKSLKLDRMRRFAQSLGNPHLDLRYIHITGSKGKGSTSAMVASILKEAGFKVGLYTSPHLVSCRERIRVNDEWIKKDELCALVDRLRPIVDRIDRTSNDYPTFFEVYTALAFLYFKERNVDFCVLEVGLGGRLDATNIIERPLCCGITPISLEHTQKLGNTVREIAMEKAEIIKEGTVCVSAPQEPSAMEVIRRVCWDRNCRLYEVGMETCPSFEVGLLGDHQLINAAVATGLVKGLRFYDIIIKDCAIREGLKNVRWPGRLQVIRENPYVVLDGAQNKASSHVLKEAVKKYFNYSKLILVLGVSKDKDIKGICEELIPISDKIILTKANLPRAEEPSVLSKFVEKETILTNSTGEAMEMAEKFAGPYDLILVTGSLFVVGEILKNAYVKI